MSVLRDLWWLWFGFTVAFIVHTVLVLSYIRDVRGERRVNQHLHNAYRRELGEPPLWPEHLCEFCNPAPDNGRSTDA